MSERIRYSRLAYLILGVTDVGASVAFYGSLVGLEVMQNGEDLSLLRCSDKPFDLMLVQSDVAGLRRISFELESAGQLERAFKHLQETGLAPIRVSDQEAKELRFGAGLRCYAPQTKLEIELIVGFGPAESKFNPTVAKIQRLGHVVMNVRDFTAAHDFWVKTLNFSVSDAVPGQIAFLRCFPNKLHHSLALISAPSDGFNHVNFMVSDIDDVGRALYRMKKNNIPIVFGPGRHLPSGSIFLYFLDPDGMTAEYSYGMEEFDEHDARDPRDLEPTAETLDLWGSTPSVGFGKNGVIVRGRG